MNIINAEHLPPLILCVEDEQDLREIIADELADAGYRVGQASNGIEALAYLALQRPALILCDIAMPGMDGYQLLRQVRETRPELDDVPFVFLTAQDGSGQIAQGKYAGADDYLVKPVHFDLMLATIAARIRQVRRMRSEDSSPTAVLTAPVAIGQARHLFHSISRLFDLITSGVIVLNGHARVQFANTAAKRLASEGCSVDFTRMINLGEATYLHAPSSIIRAAIKAGLQGEDYTDFLSMPRNDGQRDLLITVCALASATPSIDDLLVVLFVHAGSRDEPAPVKALEALFKLTPTEGRIAWAFAQGLRPDEIALAFDISATTVAFHKRNIFQKTRTNRQADLIALLLTLPASASPSTSALADI